MEDARDDDLYFRLTGSLLGQFNTWKTTIYQPYRTALQEFCAEVGTTELLIQRGIYGETHLRGFQATDKEIPGTKRHKAYADVLVPDLRKKAGKALKKRLESLDEPVPMVVFNEACPGSPWSFHRDGKYVIASVGFGALEAGVFIQLSSLAETTLHPELVPVAKWEFEKALFEERSNKKEAAVVDS
ncbi:MAG: hypothetical protein RBJ76_13615 [Stenomitos frigidus ULC029]